jgi:antitoxin component of MazEF toxin-antitoxin module
MKAKVIKIGSSVGITIPQAIVSERGIKSGDQIEVTIKPIVKNQAKLLNEYNDFISRYGQTLKNLSNR